MKAYVCMLIPLSYTLQRKHKKTICGHSEAKLSCPELVLKSPHAQLDAKFHEMSPKKPKTKKQKKTHIFKLL